MSRTLNLVDRLLAMGQNAQQVRQDTEAQDILAKLASFHELPAEVAEMAQASLAEICLRRRKYRKARRHLTVALLYRPDCARYHYLIATALQKGRYSEPDRALEHYRKAIELEPEDPQCLADFGLLCLEQGRTDEGMEPLWRAAGLASEDAAVIGKLVRGLCRTDRWDEAEKVARGSRFANPRDRRFTRLWNDFLFRRSSKEQAERRDAEEDAAEGNRPMILPFVRSSDAAGPVQAGDQIIRIDEPAPLPPPHRPPRPVYRSDWKHG